MARIKINIPEPFIFSCIIPVRIADINYGNHVGNDAFVSIIHEARMQWLKKADLTELKIEGDTGLIMADLSIEFRAESFYGDQVQVQIAAAEISSVGFELYYQLSVTRDGDHKLLANAKTGMVCYDYEKRKVAAIPQVLAAVLKG